MDKLPFQEGNEKAFEMFEQTYGLSFKDAVDKINHLDPAVRAIFGGIVHSGYLMSSLRTVFGYRCASCGKNSVTEPILRFYAYGTNAECYPCQESARPKTELPF